MKAKYGLICALSLNFVLASALNAKSVEDIAAERVDIQNIYNIYNNELVSENNSLMQALNAFATNAKDCLSDFSNRENGIKNLENSVNSFDKDLAAFNMSYKDIREDYTRQLAKLELLNKIKGADMGRINYARELLKNLNLRETKDLNQVRSLESTLNNIEAIYARFNQNLATSSTQFSLAKPQIDGIANSIESLEKFFNTAKGNLEISKKALADAEPKVEALYAEYQKYLDVSIGEYNSMGILGEDIQAKTLLAFYDLKESFDAKNGKDYIFNSYNNLWLNSLSKPQDMIKISPISVTYLNKSEALGSSKKSKAMARSASFDESAADGFGGTTNRMMMASAAPKNNMERTIKELRVVNSIIDDLNDNLNTANAVLSNVKALSSTISYMSDNSISLLRRALNLSTESQVLLTNIEISKGNLDIKSRQADIAKENIKKSLEKIEASKTKLKELL